MKKTASAQLCNQRVEQGVGNKKDKSLDEEYRYMTRHTEIWNFRLNLYLLNLSLNDTSNR